jgi:hypothetical protein
VPGVGKVVKQTLEISEATSACIPLWPLKFNWHQRAKNKSEMAFHMHSSNNNSDYFTYQEVYPCPVCRLTQLKAMPLMDAMACDCCRHIFTADIERQQLKMVDRQPPLTWRWNGRNWTGAHLEGVEWGWTYWLLAVAFVVLPTTFIWLAAYTFPPEPGSTLSWVPVFWTGLTFLSHLTIIGWLVTEFYQFPIRAYLRVRWQQLLGR